MAKAQIQPQNSQYIYATNQSNNSYQSQSISKTPVQLNGIPRRIPFNIPRCVPSAASNPFGIFKRNFPFPAKQFASPLAPRTTRTNWQERNYPYPKIIYCPPNRSLNAHHTPYEELKAICQSDLELPITKRSSSRSSSCQRHEQVARRKSFSESIETTRNSKKSSKMRNPKSVSQDNVKVKENRGGDLYGGIAQEHNSSSPQGDLSGYWPSGGETDASGKVDKESQYYGAGYSSNYPYGGYSGGSSGKQIPPKKESCSLTNSRSDEGLDFVFNPDDDMATEITVTVEPDEPDMLEYALDNGIMPVVCGYLPPHIDPTACGTHPGSNNKETGGRNSRGSFSGYGSSGYGYGSDYGYGGSYGSGYPYGYSNESHHSERLSNVSADESLELRQAEGGDEDDDDF